MMKACVAILLICRIALAADGVPTFEAKTVDSKVAIGYGLSLGDVDGDGKLDILLVDKTQVVWYHNPEWTRYVLCENVTKQDNVCIAARDIDGDGKVEIAIGAEWNPGDTVNSGSVHYLIPAADRKQKWEVVTLPREPTVHRMNWALCADGEARLFVLPLHGRGNKASAGDPVKLLAYTKPDNPKDEWKTEVVDASMHVTHNFDIIQWDNDTADEMVVGGKEGMILVDGGPGAWTKQQLALKDQGGCLGAGEIRVGKLGGKRFLATVEPFHGTVAAIYAPPAEGEKLWRRKLLDDNFADGHAVACADFTGSGSDQVIVGWRNPNKAGKFGINLYIPQGDALGDWKKVTLDENTMACEDIRVADLDGDGKPDIVASGRSTKNLIVYWNKGVK